MSDLDAMEIAAELRSTIYLFFRKHEGKEMFYPIGCFNDDDARKNAECNPGTTRVEDMDRRVVWRSDQ